MTSSINPFNIDGTYPVAGQDNDSQGFRDNFTNIRNNFTYASSEISDLQSKAVLKSALTGQTLNNNMNGVILSQAQLQSVSSTLINLGTITGLATLDFSQSDVYQITTSGPVTLAFSNFPAGGIYGEMTLTLSVTNLAHTVTVPVVSPGVTIGLGDFPGANTVNGVITFDSIGFYQLKFSTIDSGQNIWIKNASGNYATFRGSYLYLNPGVDSAAYVGYTAANLTTGRTITTGKNSLNVLGESATVSVGNLTLANVSYHSLDTGRLAGFSVISARGNLQLANVSPARGGDFIGYVNAKTFTGNGVSNVFQQVSTIGFYATGSNVAYGLGGNIAMFTADDGGSGPDYVRQAVGIENDQSVHMFGNLVIAGAVPPTFNSAGTPGQIAWDSTYFYVCVATNTWKRVQLNITSW